MSVALGIGLLSLAVVSSLFYASFAHDIHVWTKKDQTAPEMKTAYRIHQWWFNLVGSLVGWVALAMFFEQGGVPSPDEVTWGAIATALIAVLGITGHLPLTLYALAARGADLIKGQGGGK